MCYLGRVEKCGPVKLAFLLGPNPGLVNAITPAPQHKPLLSVENITVPPNPLPSMTNRVGWSRWLELKAPKVLNSAREKLEPTCSTLEGRNASLLEIAGVLASCGGDSADWPKVARSGEEQAPYHSSYVILANIASPGGNWLFMLAPPYPVSQTFRRSPPPNFLPKQSEGNWSETIQKERPQSFCLFWQSVLFAWDVNLTYS